MLKNSKTLIFVMLFLAIFIFPQNLFAYTSPATIDIGTASDFIVLTKAGIGNTGTSNFSGNIGAIPITAASMTVLCPEITGGGRMYGIDVTGPVGCSTTSATLSADTAKLGSARDDMDAAFADIATRTPDQIEAAIGIGGRTFAPGVYKFTGAVTMASDLTINGSATDIFIFYIQGAYAQSTGHMNLAGGAQAKNVFWRINGAVTIAAPSIFTGILWSAAANSLASGASVDGRIFAQTSVSTISNTISIAGGPTSQATLVTTAQLVTYPTLFTALNTTGGSGNGSVTFNLVDTGTAGCSVSGTTLSYTSAGICTVNATKEGNDDYANASSSAQNFTVNPGTQDTLLTISQSVTFPTLFTALTTSGGNGSGDVTFALTDSGTAGCSVSGTTLSYTTVGSCTVTATKAGDGNYTVASSQPQTFTINKGTQNALLTVVQIVNFPNLFAALTTTGGSGVGDVTFNLVAAGTAGCSVTGTTLSYTTAGNCTVTATKAADINYYQISQLNSTEMNLVKIISFVDPTDLDSIFVDRYNTFVNISINETNFNASWFEGDYTANETNVNSSWLEWNYTMNNTMFCNYTIGITSTCFLNKSLLPNGNYSYRVCTNDSVPNMYCTEFRNININATLPKFVVINPLNNSLQYVNSVVCFNTSLSGNLETLDKTWIEFGNGTDYTLDLISSEYRYKYLNLSYGHYNVTFHGNTTVGYDFSSGPNFFYVSTMKRIFISKEISSLSNNSYKVLFNITNGGYWKNFTLYDLIMDDLTYYNLSLLNDNSTTIVGSLSGELLLWNLSLNPLSNLIISYNFNGSFSRNIFGID
jgi:hypothetical protein